jgi:hypothetical protein
VICLLIALLSLFAYKNNNIGYFFRKYGRKVVVMALSVGQVLPLHAQDFRTEEENLTAYKILLITGVLSFALFITRKIYNKYISSAYKQ